MYFSWKTRVSICLSSSSGWMIRMIPKASFTVVKFSVRTTAERTSFQGTLLIDSVIWPLHVGRHDDVRAGDAGDHVDDDLDVGVAEVERQARRTGQHDERALSISMESSAFVDEGVERLPAFSFSTRNSSIR
jgi:hypothetical protein